MRAADLVVTGTVVTVDQLQPTAEAMAVSDGRIIAVGDRSGIERWIGADTEVLDTGDGCVMPGFVEAHGHPLMGRSCCPIAWSTSGRSPSVMPTMSSTRYDAK